MLFFRYHTPHRRDSTEGWQQASRPSDRRPHQEEYGGWEVEVTRRRVGITIQRFQYRAVVRRRDLGTDHLLTGFSSLTSAVAAARRWIDGQKTRQRIIGRRLRARLSRSRKGGSDRS